MESVHRQEGEIWRTDIVEPNNGYYFIVASSCFFYILSKVVMLFAPAGAPQWRWKNISVSFLHATICTLWTIYCFYERPDMAEDLITIFTPVSHTLVCFSFGYFTYDIVDMLINKPNRNTFELAIHHVVILACFMVAVWSRHYVGYAIVSLLVEINSIFLHFRQLLQICGVGKFNPFYRLNSLINLGTFIVFRVILLAWMTRWIVINKDAVPLVFYTMGSIGLAIMMLMNIALFLRLMHSDFIKVKDKETSTKKKVEMSSKLE